MENENKTQVAAAEAAGAGMGAGLATEQPHCQTKKWRNARVWYYAGEDANGRYVWRAEVKTCSPSVIMRPDEICRGAVAVYGDDEISVEFYNGKVVIYMRAGKRAVFLGVRRYNGRTIASSIVLYRALNGVAKRGWLVHSTNSVEENYEIAKCAFTELKQAGLFNPYALDRWLSAVKDLLGEKSKELYELLKEPW
ncbi:hypothetical protein [Pyrobaculum sp.]|uniref:hypothetical protein n=1 Tax=Pyrobaculum sp. TaxID=2004705 RepID=UPI003D0EC8C3